MFTPIASGLNTLEELRNLIHTISYIKTDGTVIPVTITADEPVDSISTEDGKIQGYYHDVFNNTISYRTKDHQLKTVDNWGEIVLAIADDTLADIYHFHADPTVRKVFSYTASANSETKTYTINVDNNWMTGRNKLVKFTSLTKYQRDILVRWINNNSQEVKWLNYVIDTVDWENSALW